MKRKNLKIKFSVISLAILGLGLSWASEGLFDGTWKKLKTYSLKRERVGNTQATAAREFTLDTPFGVNNPFSDWDDKLNDPYPYNNDPYYKYKNKITDELKDLGVGWVTDSVYRKKVEELNWDYINANGDTNNKGEIFFSSLPTYDELVKTDFETIFDNLVEAYENAGVKTLFVINTVTKWQIKKVKHRRKGRYQLLVENVILSETDIDCYYEENVILPETDIDYDYYKEYVKKLVNRYRGRVAGWFIFNEPSGRYLKHFKAYKVAVKNYARLVEITYSIIRDIDPEAIVILGGTSAVQEVDFYADVLAILQDKKNNPGSPLYGTGGFDTWDYHSYAVASEYKKLWAGNDRKAWKGAPKKYSKYRKETYRYYELYRDVLNYAGFGSKPLINKEGATYTGEGPYVEKPRGSGRVLLLQDEMDQAAFLVKRTIHLLSKGVKLINWSTILEHINYKGQQYCFFNYIGLVYNGIDNGNIPDPPGNFVPKVSFYTYKFLIEKLNDANWGSFSEKSSYPVSSDPNFDVSAYEFKNTVGETKFIAWVDYYYYDNDIIPPNRLELQLPVAVSLDLIDFAGQQVKITKAIPNAEKVLESYVESVSQNGVIEIVLSKEPVYIELNQP